MKSALLLRLLLASAVAALALPAASFQVIIDTTPLAGTPGYFAFDLLGGTPLQNNVATISSFSSTGILGSSSTSGDVTGELTAPPLVLTASSFFNEYLQEVTFGAGITRFNLNLTGSYATGSAPDSFSFFLLDETFLPVETTDPTGAGALFAIDITGASPAPSVFTSAFATVTVRTLTPPPSGVPEPATALLFAAGAAALGILRAKRP